MQSCFNERLFYSVGYPGGKHVLDSLLLLLEDPKIWHFRLGKKAQKD